MKEILLVGGGGHSRSVIDVIEQEAKYKVAGIVDRKEKVGDLVFEYSVIGHDGDLQALRQKYDTAIVTVGFIQDPSLRLNLYVVLKKLGFDMPVIRSPRAYVSKYATIGEGSIIMHDCLVNAGAVIGVNNILNTKSLIEHDALIGDHCHISTAAVVNGGAHVENCTFVGSNAVVINQANVSGFKRAGGVFK